MKYAASLAVSLLVLIGGCGSKDFGLAALPEVASITATSADNPEPLLCVVHLCDLQFVEREAFAADLRDQYSDISDEEIKQAYARHLDEVEQAQAEQMAVIQFLRNNHDVQHVCMDGLSWEDMNRYEAVIDSLDANSDREQILKVGAPGRLARDGLIEVLPLDANGFRERVKPGAATPDNQQIEDREDWQLRQLTMYGPSAALAPRGLAVLVLGGEHDLSDNIVRRGRAFDYIRVETKTYARLMAESSSPVD